MAFRRLPGTNLHFMNLSHRVCLVWMIHSSVLWYKISSSFEKSSLVGLLVLLIDFLSWIKSQGIDHRRKKPVSFVSVFIFLHLLELPLIAVWCSSILLMSVNSCLTSYPISQISNGVLPIRLVFYLTTGKKFDLSLLKDK